MAKTCSIFKILRKNIFSIPVKSLRNLNQEFPPKMQVHYHFAESSRNPGSPPLIPHVPQTMPPFPLLKSFRPLLLCRHRCVYVYRLFVIMKLMLFAKVRSYLHQVFGAKFKHSNIVTGKRRVWPLS